MRAFVKYSALSGVKTDKAVQAYTVHQCFSTFVRPRPGKFFFYKTRAQSQQIYS